MVADNRKAKSRFMERGRGRRCVSDTTGFPLLDGDIRVDHGGGRGNA